MQMLLLMLHWWRWLAIRSNGVHIIGSASGVREKPALRVSSFYNLTYAFLYDTFTKLRRLDTYTHEVAVLDATVSSACYMDFLRAHNMEAPG